MSQVAKNRITNLRSLVVGDTVKCIEDRDFTYYIQVGRKYKVLGVNLKSWFAHLEGVLWKDGTSMPVCLGKLEKENESK